MAAEDSVVLGFVSSEIEEDSDAYESKFGGWPIWLGPAPAEGDVRCGECGGPTFLVVQAYAPLAPARAHQRALHVFCCPKPKCSGSSRGWKALRSQEGASASALAAEAAEKKKPPPPEPVPMAPSEPAKAVGEFGEAMWDDVPEEGSAWCPSTAAPVPTADLDELIRMRELALEEKAARPKASAPPKSQQRSSQGPDATAAARPKPQHEQTRWGVHLAPHYMEVDYEPPAEAEAPPEAELAHARELYEEYRRREAAGDEGPGTPTGAEGGGGGDPEGYERAEGEQRAMLRFQKRMGRSPEQALRYLSGTAAPLWASGPVPPPEAVPACERCGGPRRAELQLVPPLLLHLNALASALEPPPAAASSSSSSPEGSPNPTALLEDGMDWGTVTVFSCAASCGDDAGSHPEFVFVQPPL
eukprot:tig00000402_g222.t1